MRMIDGDALMEILTTAIRNMKDMAKFLEAEDDPEIQMEIKAYTDIAEGVKGMPTIEPERKTGKWVNNLHDIPICNQCGYMTPYDRAIDDYEYGNYCPNCGAKMLK